MKQRTEKEIETLVWDFINRGADYATQSLQEHRTKAWDYFLCRPRGDEVEGRSTVVDTTLRDTHNALMSTIMPSYATDHVVQFEPVAEGDEDQADSESDAVNNIFTEDNAGFMELSNAVSDALLFRNGVLKVWVEDTVERTVFNYAAGEDVGLITTGLEQAGFEVLGVEDTRVGIAVRAEQRGQKLRVMSVEGANFYTDPNQPDHDLQNSRGMVERCIKMRGELEDMGVPKSKINKLSHITDEGVTSGAGTSNSDTLAKFQDGQPTHYDTDTWAEQRVECYWVHMLVDGEKCRYLASNNTVLLSDKVAYFPYASGTGLPVPHRWSGMGLYDLLKETQDSLTSIRRQFIDNLNHANNSGFFFDPNETHAADIASRAPGRSIQSKNPTNTVPIPIVDVSSNSLAAMQHFRELSTQQAGAALDMASADAQSVKDVSGLSVEMQLAPKEQMASHISRNLAETLVRNTFLLIHRALREDYEGEITYRKVDKWVTVRPSEWRPRNRINVTVGLSPGDKRRKRSALREVMQEQKELIAGGAANIAVNYKGYHSAVTDWMKASELDGAEGYFVDPMSEESQKAQQAAAEQSQQESEILEQLQRISVELEQAKLREDQRQHDTELRFKYWAEELKADIKEAELVESGINNRISAERNVGATGGPAGENQANRGAA